MTHEEMVQKEHRELGATRMLGLLLHRLNLPEETKQIIRLEGMRICAEGIPFVTEPRVPTNPATLISTGQVEVEGE